MDRYGMMRLKVSLLVAIYIILLIVGYIHFVPPHSYDHQHINIFALSLFAILAFTCSLWIPIKLKKPSYFAQWALYILVIAPSLIVPYMSVNKPLLQLIIFSIAIQLCFFVLTRTKHIPNIKLPHLKIPKHQFHFILLALFVFFNFLLIRQFGFNLNFVSILDVYDVRGEFKEQLGEGSNYAMRWLLYILNPFLISIGYLEKKKLLLYLGFFGEFLIYSTTGFKTALFIGFVIVGFLFAIEKLKLLSRLSVVMLVSTISLISIAMAMDIIYFHEGSIIPNISTSLTLRRIFIMPGYLTGQYFDFFSDNPKALMATNRFVSLFVKSEGNYTTTVPYIIGQHSFGSDLTSANSNIWADAYGNFGYAGMVIISIILLIYFQLYDSICTKIDPKISLSMLIGPTMFFSNSALLTAFIGHGALWALIILFLYQYTSLSDGNSIKHRSK